MFGLDVPLLLIAAVVGVVVAGIVLAFQHWGAIVSWLQGVWGAFTSWFTGSVNAVGSFFGRVFPFFHLQRPPLCGWSEIASQVALTYAASVIVGLAAQQSGRPDLIRSPIDLSGEN